MGKNKHQKDNIKNKNPLKNRMMGGAVVLAGGSIVAKIVGALYRVPLTNILGAEGMGMYQLVFPVYALFMMLATAGIPTALSRVVAEKRANGESCKKYLASALLILTLLSAVAGLLTVGLSKQLAGWQGNQSTSFGYLVVAPSILFVGVIAGLRGWFQGEMYMMPTAVSNIIEQAVKLAVGIALAVVLKPYGLIASVAGALVGITVSELFAMLYLVITYFVRNKGKQKEILKVTRKEARSVFTVAFPIAIVAILLPLSSFFDSLMIVNVLKWGGSDTALATAHYGLLSGPVVSLINMPIVIIMSLAIVIVPTVSVSRVERDITSILLKSKLSIKLTYLIGMPCAFLLLVFSKQILGIIYPTLSISQLNLAAKLLMIVSGNVVLLSAMQIYISLLQALDKTRYAVISLVCAIAIKIVLTVVLVKAIGVMGAAIASIVMSAVALLGTNFAFVKLTSLHLEKNVCLNIVSGVIMALVALGVRSLIDNDIASVIVGFLVSSVVYLWLIMMFNIIEKEDTLYLPLGKYFAKIRRVVRFWEYEKNDET